MNMKKNPFECPDVETIVKGKAMAFTFNPDDAGQFWHEKKRKPTDLSRVDMCANHMIDLLWFHNTTFKAYLQMEVSKHGRLHFHGLIRINDIRKFFVNTVRSLQHHGTYCIKEFTSAEAIPEWEKYCEKGLALRLPAIETPETLLIGNVKNFKDQHDNFKTIKFDFQSDDETEIVIKTEATI